MPRHSGPTRSRSPALAVISERLRGAGVDAHGAGSAALGGSLDALPSDDGGRARDADLGEIQVDVPPAEIEQLAATGAGVRGQRPGPNARRTSTAAPDDCPRIVLISMGDWQLAAYLAAGAFAKAWMAWRKVSQLAEDGTSCNPSEEGYFVVVVVVA